MAGKGTEGPVSSALLYAIRMVESGDKMPVPLCRMDEGSLSCGKYQIKEAYWIDAGRPGGSWKECAASDELSETCVQNYMKRYATRDRLGHVPTNEDLARIHNGGPNGFKKPGTLPYWRKVQQYL